MNPIKSLIDDFKTVVRTIKRLKNKEPVFNPERVKQFQNEMKGVTFKSYFEENWIWILTILFAFVCGWIMAANYYSIQANNFIVENCIPDRFMNNVVDPGMNITKLLS